MNLSILEIVFVTSWFWLFICAIVSLFSYVNGLNHSDDSLNLCLPAFQKDGKKAGITGRNSCWNWSKSMVWM